jgi:hypothetical protein
MLVCDTAWTFILFNFCFQKVCKKNSLKNKTQKTFAKFEQISCYFNFIHIGDFVFGAKVSDFVRCPCILHTWTYFKLSYICGAESVFVNLLRSPGIDFQPGGLVWQPRDTSYSRSVIAFFARCPVGEGTTEYTKLRFPEQGWRVH